MAPNQQLDLQSIRTALADLNTLSLDEYGIELEALLLDRSPDAALRLQRLTGIVLKRPFARQAVPAGPSMTGARNSWPWADRTPDAYAANAPREFTILNELRMPGSWNERKPSTGTAADRKPITWEELRDDADNERGLFKILALYVDDQLKRRERRSFREYLEARESRRFEAGLDLATLLFDAAVTGPVAALLGIPTLAVGVALVGLQYGYRRATDTTVDRVGDQRA